MDSQDSDDDNADVTDNNKLVVGSKWTVNLSDEDEGNGQTHARKACSPFDLIIAAVNALDVEQYPDAIHPHYKVAVRDNAKGLVILCHTCFEKKLGAEKFTIKKTSLHECHFRVQADINFVIRGNTRKNGSGPINLVHSCATAQSIERRLLEAVPTVGQRIRSAKLSSTQSVQIANYSIGTNRDSAKHVSCIGYVLICIN